MRRSTKTLVYVGAYAAAAFVVYKLASHAGAGATTIELTPGFQVAVKTPPAGTIFAIPSGSSWITIDTAPTNNPVTPTALPVPTGDNAFIVGSVHAGFTYAFQWRDPAGQTQAAFLGFV